MKTIAIITFGRSDLQFFKQDIQPSFKIQDENNQYKKLINNTISIELVKNRDKEDAFLLSKPRIDGKIILQHYETFSNIIKFPLITPFLNQLNQTIDYFILVYTNQTDEKYMHGDSLYFASIFKRFMIDKWKYKEENFIDFPIVEKLTDIDFLYNFFEKKCKNNELLNNIDIKDIEKIYLLAQGGIDQINMALTLQLIKNYKNKVDVYQTKEHGETKNTNFAMIYTRDLIFDKILLLSEKGQYAAALNLLNDLDANNYSELRGWLKFCNLRINNMFAEITNNFGKKNFNLPSLPAFVEKIRSKEPYCNNFLLEDIFDGEKNYAFIVSEYFEKARFYKNIGEKNQCLLIFSIFVESLVNYYIEQKEEDIKLGTLQSKQQYYGEIRKLLNKIKENEELENFIKTMFEINDEINNVSLPVKLGYTLYLSQEHNKEQAFFKKICILNGKYKESIFCLDDLRNKLAHTGSSIPDDNFNKLKNYIGEIEKIISPEECSYDIQNNEIAKLIDRYKQPVLEN